MAKVANCFEIIIKKLTVWVECRIFLMLYLLLHQVTSRL